MKLLLLAALCVSAAAEDGSGASTACCTEPIVSCMACSKEMTETELCTADPAIAGCGSVIYKANGYKSPAAKVPSNKVQEHPHCGKNQSCDMEKIRMSSVQATDLYGASAATLNAKYKLEDDEVAGQTALPSKSPARHVSGIHCTVSADGENIRVGKGPIRWNDAQSNTIHGEGSFNSRHMFEPARKNNYSPTSMTNCCKLACASDKNPDACKAGCGLWISKSSLNWEAGQKWTQALFKKCKRDCKSEDAPNPKRDLLFTNLTPGEGKNACTRGCGNFKQCVTDNVQDVAAQVPASMGKDRCPVD